MKKKDLPFEIVTICNNHRKPIIEEYLKDISHTTLISTDYDLPKDWKPHPAYEHLVKHMRGWQGHLRCNYGHRDALLKTTADRILVIEDDARPNTKDWLKIITPAVKLLDKHEIVSIHGREFDERIFNISVFDKKNNINLYTPKDSITYRRVLGSLSYFIKRSDISRITENMFNGLTQDLLISNCFNFCLLNPSVLDHDRSQGSLIDY